MHEQFSSWQSETIGRSTIYWSDGGKPSAAHFIGKRSRPQAWYAFRTVEQRDRYLATLRHSLASQAEYVRHAAEQKAAELAKLSVGSVVYKTWGWEQTNVSFYEVVAKTAATLLIRPVAQDQELLSPTAMQGHCTPRPGDFTGGAQRVKATNWKFRLWDGTPKAFSCYG